MACCPTTCDTIVIGSSYTVNVTSFRDSAGTYLNAGTGNWYLFDDSNSLVASGVMTYTAASSGNYTGAISASITGVLKPDVTYRLATVMQQSTVTVSNSLYVIATY